MGDDRVARSSVWWTRTAASSGTWSPSVRPPAGGWCEVPDRPSGGAVRSAIKRFIAGSDGIRGEGIRVSGDWPAVSAHRRLGGGGGRRGAVPAPVAVLGRPVQPDPGRVRGGARGRGRD